jgi:hypothetical protein
MLEQAEAGSQSAPDTRLAGSTTRGLRIGALLVSDR